MSRNHPPTEVATLDAVCANLWDAERSTEQARAEWEAAESHATRYVARLRYVAAGQYLWDLIDTLTPEEGSAYGAYRRARLAEQ
jgi:hypothetical protein